ncbi:MAG: T9SS type A sorting domain-containing protein [Bacteroidetes bacterium]|nr:T9SS type A sorting domain-containing protein [Bacteroidota bacterium]
MKNYFLLITMIAFCNHGYSQLQNANWVFGDSVGLSFSDDSIFTFNSKLGCWHASATISDSAGQLLFYTNGQSVFNKNHELMTNGDGLNIAASGNSEYPYSQYKQPVLIIPKPNNFNTFYIFHVVGNPDSASLDYSVVDLNTDDGLGMVVSKNNHILICYDFFSEDCTTSSGWVNAVRHANGRDWWLISFAKNIESIDPAKFIFILITPEGIALPKFQVELPDYVIDPIYYGSLNQTAISPSGDILAYSVGNKVDLFQFDRCEGSVKYLYSLDCGSLNAIDVIFSSDGSKLYIIANGNTYTTIRIFQFCFTCGIDVQETKTEIYKNTYSNYEFSNLQLGIDNKIYFGYEYKEGSPIETKSFINTHLSVINEPNNEGLLCDVDTLTIDLGDRIFTGGFPNIIDFDLGVLYHSGCDTISTEINNIQASSAIQIYPNPANEYIYISSETYKNEKCLLELYNSTGTLVSRYEKVFVNETIQLPKLNYGVYLAVITTSSGKQFSEKLVITE